MPSKILLISVNRCTNPDAVFPLGLTYLNAALRQAGHQTRWFDVQVHGAQPQSTAALLDRDGNLQQVVAEFAPDLVGISLRNIDDVLIRKKELFFKDLVRCCQAIRSYCDRPIVLGGSGFSIFPKELMEVTGADFGVCGEGEESLVSLVAALERKEMFQNIPGLVWRETFPQDSRIEPTKLNCAESRCASSPSPPKRSVEERVWGEEAHGAAQQIRLNPTRPMHVYPQIEPADRPEPVVRHYLETSAMINVQTQRGCSWHCGYCTYPLIEGNRSRRKSPDAVAEEFEQLHKMGVPYVFVVDSIFNSSRTHVTETCEAILEKNIKLRWGAFLRPQGLNKELVALMMKAGLTHVEFGSDSFCDEVLDAYGKNLTFEDIHESSELAREQKLDYCHFLISGGPGETIDTLRTGFENSRRLRGGVIMAVTGMRIYPGTALHSRAIREGVVKAETNLLEPVYYLAPGLTQEAVFAQLQEFARQSHDWIVGDPSPGYAKLVERLRKRGVAGPLWAYASMMQKLWPQGNS